MLDKKKGNSKGSPSARTKTGYDEPTGKSSEPRFNPKVKKGPNPSARTATGYDEETGKSSQKRFNPKIKV
jgi:hypothetical protein